MTRFIRPGLLALLVASSPALQAVPVVTLSGAITDISIDNFSEFRIAGGTGVASVFDSLPDSGPLVKSKARATLSESDGLPILEALAESFSGELNTAAARAVQKFQYQGAARTLTIDGLFEGTLTPDEARFFGEMVVWNESGLGSSESELASFFDGGGLGGIIFEGLFPEDTASTSLTNGGPFSIPLSTSIDLEDGDIFWFYASFYMQADGVGGGTAKADGFGTATFSFDDGTGISILGVTGTPVPVPAAAWLLLSGLGALICRQRAGATRA